MKKWSRGKKRLSPPKAILEFDLNDPDQKNQLEDCLNGGKYRCIIWDMDQWFRKYLKYDDKLSAETRKILEEGRRDLSAQCPEVFE